jgi:hypothetical protein
LCPFPAAAEPPVVARPDAFETLVNPKCSHCRDEAARRADLVSGDRILCWTRGYSDGGAVPIRFFLAGHRVISDSYGVFVYDPDAGFARGFAPSYHFRFHGWRNGIVVLRDEADGTLYSGLSGVAFDGPKKGVRLTSIPTLVSDWGYWLRNYPHAVAYHMAEKFKPVEVPAGDDPASVRSRPTPDPRLPADEPVYGVWTGDEAKAYPLSALSRAGLISDRAGDAPLVVLWEPATKTAAAYCPVAHQPRKFKGPAPNKDGVSPSDAGMLPPGVAEAPPRTLILRPATAAGQFIDAETQSIWDIGGRCVEGSLKGWTLDWVDAVQVKWFAWAAEYPGTSIYDGRK